MLSIEGKEINEFWKSSTLAQKRKLATIAKRTALLEEHTTDVISSTFKQERIVRKEFTKQERIVQSKFARRLENTDLDDDSSYKRQRGEKPLTPKHKIFPSNSSSEKSTSELNVCGEPEKFMDAENNSEVLDDGRRQMLASDYEKFRQVYLSMETSKKMGSKH